MAEQSMFWPTTGTGDGVSGGYTDARLKTIWKAALGNGVLQYLNKLEATGTGTSTLAVNTGAAVVEGYLYENDSSASIATASLGSATYGLYVIANEDASALAVSRSVAGTTVAAKSTRLALNSTTPAQPNIKIATVVTSGGSITSITAENNRFASSRVKTVGSSTLALGERTTNQSIANATNTVVTFGSVTNSDYVTGVAGTGVFTVKESGAYSVHSHYAYTYNATGLRATFIAVNGSVISETVMVITATAAGTANTEIITSGNFILAAGDTIDFRTNQNSGGALNLSRARCTIARLG
jgi:hypothetical protein